MNTALTVGVILYALATAFYLFNLWRPSAKEQPAGPWLLSIATIYWVPTFLVGAIYFQLCTGARPWLLVSAWASGLLYLVLRRRYELDALGSFVSAVCTLLATFALLVAVPNNEVVSGALADWVLWIHIALAFIGVISFIFATAFAVLHLYAARQLKQKLSASMKTKLPPLETLDQLSLRAVTIGFPFYTIALLLGTIQALKGGGAVKLAYLLAAVSWVIYAVVLQARLTAGWRGKRAAFMTVAGLVAVLTVVGLYSTGTV